MVKKYKTAIFIKYYNIAASPSILNTIYLLSQVSALDIYCHGAGELNAPELTHHEIKLHLFDRFRQIGSRMKLAFNKPDYDAMIVFDPQGLIFCKELFPDSKPFYYSLELFLSNDHACMYYPDEISTAERRHIRDINGLIIQSAEKKQLFLDDYGLDDSMPVFILPVCYRSAAESTKTTYLYDKYGIDKSKKILLHLGGINEYYSSLEIAKSLAGNPDWVLFMQGRGDKDYLESIRNATADSGNIIISDEYFDSIEETDKVIKSSTAGIAWYNDISANFRTAGESSGKIPAYMRCGLPIIANRLDSTLRSIEATGCGLCIEKHSEIPTALKEIEAAHDNYSANSLNEYGKKYYFDIYRNDLLKFLGLNG